MNIRDGNLLVSIYKITNNNSNYMSRQNSHSKPLKTESSDLHYQYSQKAIPMIEANQITGKYVITNQAIDFFRSLQGPLAVVSVAGLYRTGKSYLLNRVLLCRSNGFGVGPTINPCTKGLWCWNRPIRGTSSDGQDVNIIVIDTEGIGALDQDTTHDTKIFTLAILSSSCFIYNSVGSIDENALQNLSLVVNLSKHIQMSASTQAEGENMNGLQEAFPSFNWVVRDFSLQLQDEHGKSISSRDYLQKALYQQNGTSEQIKQKNKIRKLLTMYFKDRDCFTMIRPIVNEDKLQQLDKMDYSQLRPEFVEQALMFRKKIINGVKVKTLHNQKLNGDSYCTMVCSYIDAINAGKIPNLMDTWSFIRSEKARKTVQFVQERYNEKMKNRAGLKVPMNEGRLKQILTGIRKQAVDQFLRDSFEDVVCEDLLQFLNDSEEEMIKTNAKETGSFITETLKKEFEPFQKKLLSEYYSDIGSFENDIRHAFIKSIPGKLCNKIDFSLVQFELFAEKKIVEASKVFQRKLREEAARAKELKNEAELTLQRELKSTGKNAEEEKKRYQEEIVSFERKIIILESENQHLESLLQKERKDDEVESSKMKKRLEENHSSIQNLQNEVKRLSSLNLQQQQMIFKMEKEMQKQSALFTQKEQYMTIKLEEQERKIKQILQEYEKDSKNWQNERKQLQGTFQTSMKRQKQANKDMNDQFQQISQQLEHLKFVNSKQEEDLSRLKNRHEEDILHYKEKLISSNKKQTKKDDEEQSKMLEMTEQLARAQKEIKEWQMKYKHIAEECKTSKNVFEKDMAISNQKMQFLEMEINEVRAKNRQLQHSYQQYQENKSRESENIEEMYNNKIKQLKVKYQTEIEILKDEQQRKMTILKKDLNEISESKQDIQYQFSTYRKDAQQKHMELQQNLLTSQLNCRQALRKLSLNQQSQAHTIHRKQQHYREKIQKLEKEIEGIVERNSREREEDSRKTQNSVAELKKCAEMEIKQWQKRLEEEKIKNNRKIQELNDQLNRKIIEDKQYYENQIQELSEKLDIIEIDSSEQLKNIKTDFQIKMQKMGNNALEQKMDLNKRIALITQQAEMVKNNLTAQLDQKNRTYQYSIEKVKKDMALQFEQQLRMVKEALEESQQRTDTLRKSHRKAEETNFLLKADLDKDKALYKEKIQNLIKERRQLERQYLTQTEAQNKTIEELNTRSSTETYRLNNQIQRLRQKLCTLEEEHTREISHKQEEINAMQVKVKYLENKVKRGKEDLEDLMNKFQTTVKTLSKSNKGDIEKEFHDRLQKMKQDYNRKISEKEEILHLQKKQIDDKNFRLQTQNKTLRDKLLIFEMRQSNKKKEINKIQDLQNELNRCKNMIHEFRQQNDKLKRVYKQIKDESQYKMDRSSKYSDKSERFSILTENSHNFDTSPNKILRENKSMINYRPSNGPTNVKKQEKRYMNIEECQGIMKWKHEK